MSRLNTLPVRPESTFSLALTLWPVSLVWPSQHCHWDTQASSPVQDWSPWGFGKELLKFWYSVTLTTGGRIDHGYHETKAHLALDETAISLVFLELIDSHMRLYLMLMGKVTSVDTTFPKTIWVSEYECVPTQYWLKYFNSRVLIVFERILWGRMSYWLQH